MQLHIVGEQTRTIGREGYKKNVVDSAWTQFWEGLPLIVSTESSILFHSQLVECTDIMCVYMQGAKKKKGGILVFDQQLGKTLLRNKVYWYVQSPRTADASILASKLKS